MSRDDIRSIAHIGNDHNLQALAIYEQGGQRFFDVNSTARGPESQINNIINISATSPTGEITKLPHVRYQNRSGAHAEVGAMNQARLSGIQGGDATLTVIGYPICNDCRNTSVRTMAAVLNVDSLTVHDYLGNATSQFRGSQGEFFSSSKGGVTWSSGKISNYNPQYP